MTSFANSVFKLEVLTLEAVRMISLYFLFIMISHIQHKSLEKDNKDIIELWLEISNNVVCATSNSSD